MSSWQSYNGVTVADAPTGEGGQNLTDNFKFLADTVVPATFNARLTLQQGVPIPAADQSNVSALYLTPYRGSRIALFNSADSYWAFHELTEISVGTTGLAVNKNYDVFVYDNEGALTLELVAWTNDSTRATALALQEGIYVKAGATARRYVGTLRTVDAGGGAVRFSDTAAKRYVWNLYNQSARKLKYTGLSATWTQGSTGAWRQANGNANAKVELVVGVQGPPVHVAVFGCSNNTVATERAVGIGKNRSNGTDADIWDGIGDTAGGTFVASKAFVTDLPAAGYHYYAWVEYTQGGTASTTTWFGVAQASGGAQRQYGMAGWLAG